MGWIFLNWAISCALRIFFFRKSIRYYAQLIGFIEDLFIVLTIFFLLPFAPIVCLIVQILILLDHFLYSKMHLRLSGNHRFYIRHLNTLFYSMKFLGFYRFLLSAFLLILINGFGFFLFSAPSYVPWQAPLALALVIGIGRIFLSKTEIYAASNLFFKKHLPRRSPPSSLLTAEAEPFIGPKQFELKIAPQEKPHVVLLFLESFRLLGEATPNFNKLSQEGIFFSNFYANGTLTYRALIAGLFGIPPANTATGLSPYVGLSLEGLPKELKKAGYNRAFFHNGSLAYDQQSEFLKDYFDEIIDRSDLETKTLGWGAPDEVLMQYTVDWLEKQKSQTFITLFTITNHHPWILPESYSPPSFGSSPNSPRERFLKTTHYTDHALGLFVKQLRAKNLSQNTLLIITADHGQPMGEHEENFYNSRFLYEENIRIPLLILADGRIEHPKKIEDLGSHINLYPTLLDLLHLPGKGDSLVRKKERSVMFQNPYSEGFIGCRQAHWKWIQNRLSLEEELYDLNEDPKEKINLANSRISFNLREKTKNYFDQIDTFFIRKKKKQRSQDLCQELDFSNQLITDAKLRDAIHPRLRRLHLNGCLLLTDKGVGFALASCPELELLELKELSDLTDHCLEIGLQSKQKKLQELNLSSMKNLSDQGLAQLMQKCPNLIHLSLNCHHLTHVNTVRYKLVRLQLLEADSLSSETFEILFQNNPHLNRLMIDGCQGLKDKSLTFLKNHPLEHLSLSRAAGLTVKGIDFLRTLPLRSLELD